MDILTPAHIDRSATQQLLLPLLKIYQFCQKPYLKDMIAFSEKFVMTILKYWEKWWVYALNKVT